MTVPFVDLSAIHAPIEERMLAAIADVVSRNRYILGPDVTDFEAEVASWLSVKHAIGVSSGTDALLLSLMAKDIGPGDEVITTPFTYVASASTIARVGATPVFADIEAESFNLCPQAVESAITEKTRAIVVVHLFGRPANMGAIGDIAARHGLDIIEDCAQAIGAEDDGRRVGGIGEQGCFSFFPAKNLGCLGDGGLVTTNDDAIADRLRLLRVQGRSGPYIYDELGGNFRLDALQAAVLRVKLPELEGWTAARQDNAERYRVRFRQVGLDARLTVPTNGPGRHVYNQFVVRIPGGKRDTVQGALRAEGIGCAVYYPKALHHQEAFKDVCRAPNGCPEADRACDEVLALPVAPGLTEAGQEQVIACLERAL